MDGQFDGGLDGECHGTGCGAEHQVDAPADFRYVEFGGGPRELRRFRLEFDFRDIGRQALDLIFGQRTRVVGLGHDLRTEGPALREAAGGFDGVFHRALLLLEGERLRRGVGSVGSVGPVGAVGQRELRYERQRIGGGPQRLEDDFGVDPVDAGIRRGQHIRSLSGRDADPGDLGRFVRLGVDDLQFPARGGAAGRYGVEFTNVVLIVEGEFFPPPPSNPSICLHPASVLTSTVMVMGKRYLP